MDSRITAEPIPTIRVGPPAEVEYTLACQDHVACWMYLAHHAPEKLSDRVRTRLQNAIGGVVVGVQALVILTAVSLFGSLVSPFAAFFCASLLTPATFLVAIPLNLALMARPRFLGRVSRWRLFRWACSWGLRFLSRLEEREGRLDTASTYRFTMTAEGFTQTAERQTGGEIRTLTTRHDQGPWTALTLVGATADHVFLVAGFGNALIIPRRAFADDRTFADFVEVVRRYHAGVNPSPTGITARTDSIRPPSHVTR